MTNEELKAKLADVKNIDEAYALAKECGFPGTVENFKAEFAKAANSDAMDMDAMDSVAGGTGMLDGSTLSMVPENLVPHFDDEFYRIMAKYAAELGADTASGFEFSEFIGQIVE